MKPAVILLIYSSCAWSAFSAPFQDLGFDDANTNNLTTTGFPPTLGLGIGTPSDLLPGWQLYYGGGPYSDALWVNLTFIDTGLASLYNRSNVGPSPKNPFPVAGAYSFAMWPGFLGQPLHYTPFVLSQTGDVPANAQALHFTIFGGQFEVRVNDNLLNVSYTEGPPTADTNTRRGDAVADISAFAGKTVTLKFITLDTQDITTVVNGLDSIDFAPVPEPGTLAILSIGLATLGGCWLRRARSAGSHRRR